MKKIISFCVLAGVCLTSSMCVSVQKPDTMTLDEKLEHIERATQAKRDIREASEAFRIAITERYYDLVLDKDMFALLDDCPVKDTPPPSPRKK